MLVEREPVQVVLCPERRLDPLRVVKDPRRVGRAFLERGLASVLDVVVKVGSVFGVAHRVVALVAVVKCDILVAVGDEDDGTGTVVVEQPKCPLTDPIKSP